MAQLPDLAALALLCAVAEHGSLSRAAASIGMVQPNATRTLRQLESELGFRLVDRGPRGSTLTHDGAIVADWASDVVAAARGLRSAAEALRDSQQSHVRVAASKTVAEAFLPRWLAVLRAERPQVALHLTAQNSHEVQDAVEAGDADVGFVESPGVRRGLRHAEVARDRLVVVVSPQHPWARRRRPVTDAELARTPLVVREPGSGTRTTFESALAHLNPVAPTLELDSNAAVRISVASGAGPAVLSELAVADAVRSGELVTVPTEREFARRMRAVWLPGTVHDAAELLVSIARRARTTRVAGSHRR
ncbi:LysR family transcriptional regulator [Paramicrobacterium agarici]|uniref:LysR family transcriptional regulator n=1 Tax=Paramicrobacterium agarici TaxID=630514 RepID=UPI001151D2AA|nr:LysR family transcriptional regulator [Microbacterium agarici]TQO22169.1 DNA-binding transcriptional LysR family regulator [Microbacterium agarici]